MHIYIDDNSNPLKEFHLPVDFYPELSRTNPFLTDEGSQSIPITLLASEHNMKLVKFPYRGVSSKRPTRKLDAIFADGTTWIKGTLFIEEVNEREGIKCTFYTNEGQLYEKLKNIKMGDIKWPVMKDDIQGSSPQIRIQNRLNQFLDIMKSNIITTDYYIFPIATSYSLLRKTSSSEYRGPLILNEPSTTGKSIDTMHFKQKDPQEIYIEPNTTKINLPAGYGITPFLTLKFVIKHIFTSLGYNLDNRFFTHNVTLMRLVLLNNTADTICDNGNIDYKNLIPDQLSVEEFLNNLRRKFGIEFIEKNNNISIRPWTDVLTDNTDMDLSKFVSGSISFASVDKRQLEIKMNRSISEAKTETDTFIDFFNKYGRVREIRSPMEGLPYEISLFITTGQYLFRRLGFTDEKYDSYPSSTFFDHKEDVGDETETIEMKDLAVPCYLASPSFKGGFDNSFVSPIIQGIRHKTTKVSYNDNSKKENNNEDEPLDVMMCFSVPRMQTHAIEKYPSGISYFHYSMGSSFMYEPNGSKWGSFNLQATGNFNLYHFFYTERDEMLKKANQQLYFNANMPISMITTMDVSVPKIINGKKILIERIDYVMGRPDLCKITARTLHEYPD